MHRNLNHRRHNSTGAHHARKEELFIPVNPFKFRRRKKKFTIAGLFSPPPSPTTSDELESGSPSSLSSGGHGAYGCDVDVLPVTTLKAFFEDAQMFLGDTLPRQLYLNMLLRIPAMYFTRVSKIFEDAEVSRPDIQRMIHAMCDSGSDTTIGLGEVAHINNDAVRNPATVLDVEDKSRVQVLSSQHDVSGCQSPLPFPDEWTPTTVTPSLFRFKHSWEAFIDSLIREWKTLNVVSALLSSYVYPTPTSPLRLLHEGTRSIS